MSSIERRLFFSLRRRRCRRRRCRRRRSTAHLRTLDIRLEFGLFRSLFARLREHNNHTESIMQLNWKSELQKSRGCFGIHPSFFRRLRRSTKERRYPLALSSSSVSLSL